MLYADGHVGFIDPVLNTGALLPGEAGLPHSPMAGPGIADKNESKF
jgi:hypothetical protein